MNMLGQLREKIAEYIDVNVKLAKITFVGRTANLLSYFLYAFIGIFIFFILILFAGMGLVEVFSDAGLSRIAAFFITAGVYVLLLLLIVALRKNITTYFANVFISVLTEGDETEEE